MAAMVGVPDITDEFKAKVSSSIEIAKKISEFETGLPEQSLLSKATAWIATDMSMFLGDMSAFGVGFSGFMATMVGVPDITDEFKTKVTSAIGIAEQISNFETGLPEQSLLSKATAWIATDMSIFSGDMLAFGVGFSGFMATMAGVPDITDEFKTKVSSSVEIAKKISEFETGLPEQSLLTKATAWIATDMSIFSGDMSAFGVGFSGFMAAMAGVPDITDEFKTKVSSSVDIAGQISTLNSGLKEVPVFTNIFGWKTAMDTFSTDMVSFGTAIASFSTSLNNAAIDGGFVLKSASAVLVASAISELLVGLAGANIDDRSGLEKFLGTGQSTGDTLFSKMKTFGESIADVNTSFAGIDSAVFGLNVAAAKTAVESIAGLLTWLSSGTVKVDDGGWFNSSTFSQLMGKMMEMADKIVEFNSKTTGVDTKKVSSIINAVASLGMAINLLTLSGDISGASSIGEALAALSENLVLIGTTMSTDVGSGIQNGKDPINKAWDEVMSATFTRLNLFTPEFVKVGAAISSGLAQGITEGQSGVITAAVVVAASAFTAAKSELGIESPSKEFRYLGEMVVRGFTDGFVNEEKPLLKESESLWEKLKRQAQEKLEEYVDPFLPEITPVLEDLKTTTTKTTTTKTTTTKKSGISTKAAARVNYMGYVGKGLSQADDFSQFGAKLDDLGKTIANMKIVMDSGALVGEISSQVDDALGRAAQYAGRR
jgi:hypothetical protein